MIEQENLTVSAESVFLLISDKQLLGSMDEVLNQFYSVSLFSELTSFLMAVSSKQPDFIICHQDFVEDHTVLSDIKIKAPDSRQLVVGSGIPVTKQIEAIKQGARGYFALSLPLNKLHDALQCILHGEVWIDRHTVSALIDEMTHEITISSEQQQALDSLSPKELEVAKRVSHGATNKMIANEMKITERTVKAHLTAIFHKTHVPDRLSLAILFRDLR